VIRLEKKVGFKTVHRMLGNWWIESAVEGYGIVPIAGTFPVVSVDKPDDWVD